MTVEVCPICDIAGCKHIRERTHPMTHDTPPKRIWVVYGRVYDRKPETPGLAAATEYTLTSEADAMVAAVVREAAAHGDAWIAVFGDVEIKHTPANAYAADAVLDYQDAILALIPAPASAALDKLIAEAVKAERAIWTQAIETYFDATAVQDVEQHVAAIRAIPSATQAGGWMPPEDRKDGYRCLGFETLWSTVEWREGYWLALTENDDRLLVTPIAFAPLPPAPEGEE